MQANFVLGQGRDDYYLKSTNIAGVPKTTHDLANRISIELHHQRNDLQDLTQILHIRTAYRNDPDFQLDALSRPPNPGSHRLVRANHRRRSIPFLKITRGLRGNAWPIWINMPTRILHSANNRADSLARLQAAISALFSEPPLRLQDFGGVSGAGTFRFAKGATPDFHYKNLSAGEKAAFDVLLDVFVASSRSPDLIYCIDEPEVHLAPSIQRALLRSLLGMLPDTSQLWIATHAAGFINEAKRSMVDNDNVAFLDFGAHDFDQPTTVRGAKAEPKILAANLPRCPRRFGVARRPINSSYL